MEKISHVITWELFLNAFNICKSYANSLNLNDVNILLLKEKFNNITEHSLKKYYKLYVETEAFYGFPVLFSSDVVQIPKGISGFREYRFFDVYAMILYNAVGLLFYKVCNDTIQNLNLKQYNVFRYVPTVFFNDKKKSRSGYEYVKASKDYTNDYNNYLNKIEESIKVGKCILKIDISKYFDSISHDILINLLKDYSIDSTLAEYNIDKESMNSIQFYFESMMGRKIGIPQGRDNCFSDYLGDIYLKQFDFDVTSLCVNTKLKFHCMIRYVDDITLVFDANNNLQVSEHHKILLSILENISKYFLEKLNLRINSDKVQIMYFENEKQVSAYIEENKKKVSSKENLELNNIKSSYKKFVEVLRKFKLFNQFKFEFKLTNGEREVLKCIFNKNFRQYLYKKENIIEINQIIDGMDLELTTDSMYIMIILFFLKNDKEELFFTNFRNKLKELDILDKRVIHIAMLSYTQKKSLKNLRINIKSHKEELINDNYGKYLIPLANYYELKNFSYLDDLAIYNIISWRYKFPSLKSIIPDIKNESVYNQIYNSFIKNIEKKQYSESQILQLKDFTYHYKRKEWNLAYNNFYNFFHETCKVKFSNFDNGYNINQMISDLCRIGLLTQKDNLNLIKFGDCRNFNSISHPSKNRISAIKVSEEKLKFYIDKIGTLLIKLLNYYPK